jgi:hypothetical protein
MPIPSEQELERYEDTVSKHLWSLNGGEVVSFRTGRSGSVLTLLLFKRQKREDERQYRLDRRKLMVHPFRLRFDLHHPVSTSKQLHDSPVQNRRRRRKSKEWHVTSLRLHPSLLKPLRSIPPSFRLCTLLNHHVSVSTQCIIATTHHHLHMSVIIATAHHHLHMSVPFRAGN